MMKTNTHLYAVVLAGGSGTRFWPVSRKSKPKQFLNITGRGTLLEETLARIKSEIPGKRTFIITNTSYGKEVGRQASRFKVPRANILLEPKAKNTAPAICWAAAKIQRIDPEAVLAILPSDHLILKKAGFLRVLREAVRLAGHDHLVTLGIQPTRPETGYGYLKTAKKKMNGKMVLKVERFTEKPSLPKAKRFLKSKNYLWNSGMFVWKSAVILKEFRKYLPGVYRLIGESPSAAHIRKVWRRLPAISIDYGILEKAKDVVAVPARDIGWSDLGSWESLSEVLAQDKRGNIIKGDAIALDCRNALVWSEKKLVAALGLKGMVVIDTPDALLVCPAGKSQAVRAVVDVLKKKNRRER